MPQNETYELRIHFGGMCLFARDPERRTTHVLMPDTGKHPHSARLLVAAHHIPGDGFKKTRYPFKNVALDLTSLGDGSLAGMPLPDEVVDLSEFLNEGMETRKVPRELVDGPPADGVVARISLDDGAMLTLNRGITWMFGPTRRFMAISGEWVVQGVKEPLELPVDGGLRLVPKGGQLRISLFNTPPGDEPGYPVDLPYHDVRVEHFQHYYPLFGEIPDSMKVVPERPEPSRGAIAFDARDVERADEDASVGTQYTCIMAQAEVASP